MNQVSKLDRYPIPKVEDLLATLAGGQKNHQIGPQSSLPSSMSGRTSQAVCCS